MNFNWSGSFRYRRPGTADLLEAAVVSSRVDGLDLPSMPRLRLIYEKNEAPGDSKGSGASRIDVLVETRETIEAQSLSLSFPLELEGLERVSAMGFQSWTESREMRRRDRLHGLNLLFHPLTRRRRLEYLGDYHFNRYTGRAGDAQSYTYFYRKFGTAVAGEEGGKIELWGSLDESAGYTRFHWNWREGLLTVEKECEGLELGGGELLLSLRLFTGSEEEVFSRYLSHFDSSSETRQRIGWSSGGRPEKRVGEETVRETLEAFRSRGIPLDLFLIDDGWQRVVGDWLEGGDSFPSGMAALGQEIKAAGYTPGIWIAPFIVEESSQIFRQHHDWCIRDRLGDPLVVGYDGDSWNGRFYALDPLFPQVYEYLRRVFRTIFDDWGFEFVTLDYLYAAALKPREGRSRGRIMHESLRMLRELTGERVSMGSGVPVGSAFGFFDYCRIGAETSPFWENRKLLRAGFRERASSRSSLRSTIARRSLSGRVFGSAPGLFSLCGEKQKMSGPQRRTLFLVHLVYGDLHLTGDNPAEYDERGWKLYLSQFPLRKTVIEEADEDSALFRTEDQRYRLFHNLGSKRKRHSLPEGLYYGFEEGFFSGGDFELNPYESRLYLLVDASPYAVAGSTGLALPGSEVDDFRFDEGRIDFSFRPGTLQGGRIFLKVPSFLRQCTVNGTSYPCEEKIDMNLVVVERSL